MASDSVVLTFQSIPGVCRGPTNGIGCASDPSDGLSGNPNHLANCFDVAEFGVTVPFELDAIRFWIGDSSPPPPDLQLNIWPGSPLFGPISNVMLYSQELSGYVPGENIFETDMDVIIFQNSFCIGLTSQTLDAGLRIQTDDSGQMMVDGGSYLRSPTCGVPEFISLEEAGLTNDFCIEALVTDDSDSLFANRRRRMMTGKSNVLVVKRRRNRKRRQRRDRQRRKR
eukprot:CAMPEP_0201190818 /NCGR_PEP_ID=MMETSP0851-20130426/140996_1 /ASSEMBLY_ACC=CAM_ASM_000631 /TAXON_ID=183588 /ORGANISM="Pseudo-nitzschia fraudulenta, Strain WWA7" /LENGTH=225 /DNA_ID=CAMNT_0047476863 /DNA_START=128 /DNA_END=805 /DNA_ORIENTATION=-